MSDLQLRHYQDFKQTLQNYQVSESAKQVVSKLRLVLLVAPSSTGRNTVIRKLLTSGNYYFIVSDTTRPPQLRDGKMEQDGVDYFFRSEEEVLADLKAGEFIEAAIIHEQQVSGVSIRELNKAVRLKKIAITDMEVVGADNVVRVKPDTTAIFLVPPSFGEWQRRLTSRGKMSEQEVKNRLKSADKEFVAALSHSYYQYVVSDDIERVVQLVDKLAHGHKDSVEQRSGRMLIETIHSRLQVELGK